MDIKTLKIVQHNVRSWRAQKINLYNIYRDIDPDIILINSHGCTADNKIKLFNYTVYQSNKAGEQHDGVAIAIKRDIKHVIIDNFNEEFLAVKVKTTLGDIQIATTYLPPRRNILPAEDMMTLLNSMTPTYILGDFNARHRVLGHNDNNNIGTGLANIMNTGKLIHLGPYFPTFIGARTQSTPDRVFTNNKAFLNYYLQEGPLTGSDHLPVIMTLSTSPIQIPVRSRFIMHKANWDSYREELQNYIIPHLQGCNTETIENEIVRLQNAIINAANNNIPVSKYRTLVHNKINDKIRILQTQFNNILRYMELHQPTVPLMSEVRGIQVELQQECLIIYNETWNELIYNTDTTISAKEFWKNINTMLGQSKTSQNYIKDQNGNKLTENYEIELAFRRHWEKIFTISEEENENFDEEHEHYITELMDRMRERTLPYTTVDKNILQGIGRITEPELLHYLRHTKEKTPGFTAITRNMIYNLPQPCINALLEIFNSALSAGHFMSCHKTAKMIFIPKEGKDPLQVINNRPISLLEVISKLYEKCINDRLTKHRNNRQLNNPRQHGFLKGKGTHTALAIISELIASKKTAGHQVNVILRDVKKAFDKVWHEGLKFKILNLGLPISH